MKSMKAKDQTDFLDFIKNAAGLKDKSETDNAFVRKNSH